jgi:serine phosphatase RsbU (regulator of sigma subunit)
MQLTTRRAILLYTVVPVIVIFAISAASGVTFLKSRIESQVNEQMTKVASGYANGLNYILRRMAGETQRTADTLQAFPDVSEDELYTLLRLHVGDDPVIYGAAIAFIPYGYRSDRKLFSPYVFHGSDGMEEIDIGTDSYDYTDGSWEWWSAPKETGKGIWTEPYLDEGAGNILMTTYSTPFFFPDGRFRGVVTLDIGLKALRDERFKIGHKEFALISRNRNFLYHFNSYWIGKTVDDLIEQTEAETGFDTSDLADQALSGKSGGIHIPVRFEGDTAWLFYAPVESSGWTLGLWMDDSKTFEVVRHNLWRNILFLGLFLLLLSFAVFKLSKRFSEPMEQLAEQCRRMERLNFQPSKKVTANILEMKHLASTLERMRQALFSVSSVREDTRIAKSIRKQTLPTCLPHLAGFDIQIYSELSQDIGGEIYDAVEFPNRSLATVRHSNGDSIDGIALMVIDAAGFGLDVTVTGSQLRAIFRSAVRMGIDVQELAKAMNQYLSSDISINGLAEAWFGVIEKETSCLTYLSLGQMPALYFVAVDSTIRRLENHPQQLGSATSATIPRPETVQMATGDILVLVSDGVASALNTERIPFGAEGVQQVIAETSAFSAMEIVQATRKALTAHTAAVHTSSDLTIAVIKCTG